MTATVINEKERKKQGLPKVKFSRRGNMYTSPKEIISSKEGRKLIHKLSSIKVNKTGSSTSTKSTKNQS
jgi:hypothetical protein